MLAASAGGRCCHGVDANFLEPPVAWVENAKNGAFVNISVNDCFVVARVSHSATNHVVVDADAADVAATAAVDAFGCVYIYR